MGRQCRGRRLAIMAVLAVSACALPPLEAWAQGDNGAGPVPPDSAAAIRSSLERPPAKPRFDTLDGVTLPFRIAFFPLRLLGKANAKVIGFIAQLEVPREPSLFELLAVEGLRPQFSSIGDRSGVAAGLRFDRWSPVVVESAFSIRGSQRHRVGLEFDRPVYRLAASYTFRRDAEPHFYGIGPNSRAEDKVDYRWDRQIVATVGTLRRATLSLDGGVGYEDNRVARGLDGGTPDIQNLPQEAQPFGVSERTHYFLVNLMGTLDRTYNRQQFQRRGLFLRVASTLFLGVDGTESDFLRVGGVVHGYIPVNIRQSLALRGLVQVNRGWDEGVPFTHLARLGDEWGSRAYTEGRFRDRDMLALMSEWRYEVWRELHERGRVESFLFLDTGAVDHRLPDLSLSQLRWSYGFGIRMIWSGQVRWLAYLGFGDDGARLNADFSWVY